MKAFSIAFALSIGISAVALACSAPGAGDETEGDTSNLQTASHHDGGAKVHDGGSSDTDSGASESDGGEWWRDPATWSDAGSDSDCANGGACVDAGAGDMGWYDAG